MLSLLLIAQFVVAQGAPFTLAPDSKLWIEGDSSLHPWACKATAVQASIDADVDAEQPARGLTLRIPVAGLECGSGTMNGKLRDALKSEQYPAIEYKLTSTERIAGEGVVLKATGALTIAGRTRTVVFVVDTATNPDRSVYAIGSVPLLMTDYGVEPPSAMLGLLKTHDRITVKFEIHTIPRPVVHASLP